jgi:hypothetical protein
VTLQNLLPVRDLNLLKRNEKVRQILGLFAYFASYIPNYAFFVTCLTNLTTKKITNEIN